MEYWGGFIPPPSNLSLLAVPGVRKIFLFEGGVKSGAEKNDFGSPDICKKISDLRKP
jgi:hypothetical protein